jgi:hypothetical protein
MSTRLSSVRIAAIVFGAALFIVGIVLSLAGAPSTAQAETHASLNTISDLGPARLAATDPVTNTHLSDLGLSKADKGTRAVTSPGPAMPAVTYQVTNTNASGPGSLRQAILNANANAGADTIAFAPNVSGTIVLTGSLPAIADTLTINGPGTSILAVSGANAYGVFLVNASTVVTITSLTIRDGHAAAGGGISSAGALVLNNTKIFSNTADYGGGVFQSGSGRVDIISSLIVFNHSGYQGGGLYINGDVALTDTLVLTNTASADGGGLTDWAGRTDLTGGTFAGNSAGGNGGGVNVNNSLSISGTQFISNTAANGGGVLQWNTGYTVAVINARFERNHSVSNGGSLYVSGSTALTNTQVLSSTAGSNGGGVYVSAGRAALSGVQVFSNTASGGEGGGVYVNAGSPLIVTDSSVSSNTAFNGGGIVNEGSTLTLTNSTLSGNWATSSSYGGGAIAQWGGSSSATIITNSTIVSNTAAAVGHSGIYLRAGKLNIGSSIVAHNGVTNNVQIDIGTFNSLGYNLTNSGPGTPFTATTDLTNTNPLLGPLQDNGGSSWTHALLASSPAIDRIPTSVNGCGTSITTDQRGYLRPIPVGGKCDIGAYEVQSACRAQIGTGATFDSGDAAAVQAAIDMAPPGDTVKVAGTCAGVEQRAGLMQTAYLAKPLTVRGGYTLTNWTTSNPMGNPTVLDARQSGRVIYLTGGLSVTLENLTVRGGATTSYGGGGVYVGAGNATLNGLQIVSNTAPWGGGILNEGGILAVNNCTVSGNSADRWGGGIVSWSGTLTLTNSTLSSNQARGGDLSFDGGGAMDLYGALNVVLIDSTVVSNTASIANVTKSGIWLESGTLKIQNSIVAHNGVTNNVRVESSAAFLSQGYNLTNSGPGTPFTTTTDITNTNPLLGLLQDNGGSSWTHALLPGSPAIDRIPFNTNSCGTSITTDQRGWARPWPTGGQCDIGAYEVHPAVCVARFGAGTTYSSGDAMALQAAVDAAPPGDTVKVAGMCAGVEQRAGIWQTVYIAKPLTLRGGYTLTNWTTSNPIVNLTILDAKNSDRVAVVTGRSGVSVTLENLTVRNGLTGGVGGGILNDSSTLYVSNTIISGNSAYMGGGMRNEQGILTVVNSVLANNSSSLWGGGIANYSGTLHVSSSTFTSNTSSWHGGGIADNGNLTVTNSTLAGNSAQRGGGLFVYWGVISMTNSTLSGNSSTQSSASNGGGAIEYLFNPTPAVRTFASLPGDERASGRANFSIEATSQPDLATPSAIMLNCTVVSNTAVITNISRSGIWLEGGTLDIGNSIIAHNGVTNNVAIYSGTLTSLGYNLTNSGAGTPFTTTGDLTDTNPLLGPLQDNGGSTWTHALLPGSPAINHIPNSVNGCGTSIITDQRGWPRPFPPGGQCDIGAFEAIFKIYLPLVIK